MHIIFKTTTKLNVTVMVVVLLWCRQVCPYIIKLFTKIVYKNGNVTAAPFQHEVLDMEFFSIVEKPKRHAVAARWCFSPQLHMSRVMRKPTFWFPTWSDTNQAVQLQKMARDLKFRI